MPAARMDGDLIVMDAAEAVATCRLAPDATVIATHMETSTTPRHPRRTGRYATAQGISAEQLLIPRDGEMLQLISREA